MKATIIAHGSLNNFEIIKRECTNCDIIICADGGAEFASKNSIIPNYLIGDFDSIDELILEYYGSKDTEIIRYPVEKDFTDKEICINKALQLNCDEICILGGLGGRLDHSLGNIGLLHKIKEVGATGYIAGDDCYIYLCDNELTIVGEIGDLVSIMPFKDDAFGVCLEGFKYPLREATIKFGQPIGISNLMERPSCNIKVSRGELLVIKNNIV
jgi:thiamine pyrophosphokinase